MSPAHTRNARSRQEERGSKLQLTPFLTIFSIGGHIMYVYIQSEPGLWTVGFFDPQGNWHTDSVHDVKEEAAKRVAWLNGANISFAE